MVEEIIRSFTSVQVPIKQVKVPVTDTLHIYFLSLGRLTNASLLKQNIAVVSGQGGASFSYFIYH